ncbi:hypothetical protein HGB07_00055 [Candidatus Roizmanbacteria bacterium]|nr:hypothetical protein [Candidatus Roizmanbacteria bacterium]
MTDSSRISGMWWMSDNPNNKVPGDLLVDDGKLELNGSFEGFKPGVYGKITPGLVRPIQDKTIIGVSRSGSRRYTLEYFANPATTLTMNADYGYKVDTYSLGRIFEGEHFDRIDNLKFKKYYVEYPNVFNWIGDGIITITTIFPKEGKKLKKNDITNKVEIRSPKDIIAYKCKDFKLAFTIYRGSMPMSPSTDIHISQGCNVKIESAKGIELSAAQETYAHIRRFLSIAIGRDVEPTNFRVLVGRGRQKKYVTMVTKSKDNVKKKNIHQHEMSFVFADIKKDSQKIFDKWFSDKNKHTDMFDLFSSIRSNSPKNINNYFKDVVSALEGYVSVETGKFEVSPDKAVKTLNEVFPKAERIIDPKDYNRIRITRNKLSHVKIQAKDEASVMDYNDKYINANRMVFLLEYSLLKNLGVEDSILDKFYKNRKLYL